MNKISAIVSRVESFENISIVCFTSCNQQLKMMSLELSEDIQIGVSVLLGVKASNISIAKDFSGSLSISNQLSTTLVSLNNGNLLTSVKLNFGDAILESIITLESSKRLNLQENDTVVALIKSSDLSILEVIK